MQLLRSLETSPPLLSWLIQGARSRLVLPSNGFLTIIRRSQCGGEKKHGIHDGGQVGQDGFPPQGEIHPDPSNDPNLNFQLSTSKLQLSGTHTSEH